MFSSFLNPQPQSRSRSKSPGARQSRDADRRSESSDERDKYRRTSRSKRSETESDDDSAPEAPRYEERTPDAYASRPSRDDRRKPSRADSDYATGRKSSSRVHEEEDRSARSRRERDPYGYAETPQSARPNGAYANGEYSRRTDLPGAFPTQTSANAARPQIGSYAQPGKFEYAKPDPGAYQYNYNNTNNGRQPSYSKAYDTAQPASARTSKKSVAAPQPSQASRKGYQDESDNDSERHPRERRQSYHRERSPNPTGLGPEQLRKSLHRLSTSGTSGATLTAGTPQTPGMRPPASPLLESYKGTYQTISPLPSPLALALRPADDDLSDLDLSESGESDDEITKQIRALERKKRQLKAADTPDSISPRTSGTKLTPSTRQSRAGSTVSATSTKSSKTKKSVSFYDAETHAKSLADALKGTHRAADVKPLLKILPWLSTDEMHTLVKAYKNHAKINGQGINLSKHIKTRISGNLGKILYATSLGQYESDAYWANCFYQSGASRRELLIESLVGRSNQQIREIKDKYKDKKYDDDLEKCMRAELKADKFRKAILLALEERRMPEGLGIDMRRVHEDGLDLYQALNSPGGESAMIEIVMLRSDDHLREVMRYYERSYRKNFARAMIEKSQNLVGETLAHILNGALNRAMRDAILLHQAIEEFAPPSPSAHARTPSPIPQKPTAGRAELLISRVVRMHWEPKHMERVKREYQERYRESVARAIARDVQGGMKTDDGKAWAGFVVDLVRSSEAV